MYSFNEKTIIDEEEHRNYLIVFYEIENLFKAYNSLKISEIIILLKKKGIKFNQELFRRAFFEIYVGYGRLIRKDTLGDEPTFTYLDKYCWNSSYSKSYANLKDNGENKKILLISDLHLGNKEFEDYELLNNIITYANNLGITDAINLGDTFDGGKNNAHDLMIVIKNLIAKLPNNINIYTIKGNHDRKYDEYFRNISTYMNYDLRNITMYKNNFYILPREHLYINFGNSIVSISHKLFYSEIIRDLKISEIDDIENKTYNLYSSYDIHISGHLHNGFIKCTNQNKLYISVPSTSKININREVAYVLSVNYENNNIKYLQITPLIADTDKKIYQSEGFLWNSESKKKLTYQK